MIEKEARIAESDGGDGTGGDDTGGDGTGGDDTGGDDTGVDDTGGEEAAFGKSESEDNPGPLDGKYAGQCYPESQNSDKGICVLSPDYAATAVETHIEERPELYEGIDAEQIQNDLEAIRNEKLQVIAEVEKDEEGTWQIQAWEVRIPPDNNESRPSVTDKSSDADSPNNTTTDSNPTLKYQEGSLAPDRPSDTPSVDQSSANGSADSLLPQPGNSNGGGRGDHEKPSGLPGLGNVNRPKNTQQERINNVIDDAKRWSQSFSNDLKDANSKIDASSIGLNQGIKEGLDKHNSFVSGLDQKMKISEGIGTLPGEQPPDLPPLRPTPQHPFVTPPNTPQGKALIDVRNYRNFVQQTVIAEGGPHQETRKSLVDLADLGLDIADETYSDGNLADGDKALDTALGALDIALDFVPAISAEKDLITIATGVNPITGETASAVDRVVLTACLFFPPLLSGTAKNIVRNSIKRTSDILSKIGKKGRKSEKITNSILKDANKIDDKLTGTVWDAINELGPIRKGTIIPERFEIVIGDTSFEVLERATKHMEEKLVGSFDPKGGRVSHNNVIKSQVILSSFAVAVSEAKQQGIVLERAVRRDGTVVFEKFMKAGGWELKFSAPLLGQNSLTKITHASDKSIP